MKKLHEWIDNTGYNLLYYLHALICIFFSIFPIDEEKIHVSCWTGKGGFSCNPKSIIQELEKEYPNKYKIYWAVNNPNENKKIFPSYIKLVKYHSLKSLFHQMTAFLWIDNCRKDLPYKRKNQFYLQTWHGSGPMKKVEKDVENTLPHGYRLNAQKDSLEADCILSGSELDSNIYRNSFWYNGLILESGYPKTDIIFSDYGEIKRRFCKEYHLKETTKFVIYAPTFRDHKRTSEFQYELKVFPVLSSLKRKYGGDWILLLRMHKYNCISVKNLCENNNCIDVSSYSDIQELLSFVDVAIDDYSSWLYDFMLTGRPCFLFTPDLSEYYDYRGFYIDLYSLPYPISTNMESLCNNIEKMDDEECKRRSIKFLKEYNFFNDGHAAQRVVKWINDIKKES